MQLTKLATDEQGKTIEAGNAPRQPWSKPQLVELPIQETASGDIPGIEGSGVFDDDLVIFTNSS